MLLNDVEMQSSQANLPWQTAATYSGLVPIRAGAVKISATVSGQSRPSSSQRPPLVILVPGLGGVAAEFVAVAELVHPFARVLRFDRAGYGDSTRPSQPKEEIPMAEAAEDLRLVLDAIGLPPPYILVGQSLGGLFVREFLQQRGSAEVSGMVLVDAFPIRPLQGLMSLQTLIGTLCGDTPFEDVSGVSANSALDQEQKSQAASDLAKGIESGAVLAELKAAVGSESSINKAQQLFSRVDEDGLITEISFGASPLGNGRLSIIVGDFARDLTAALQFGKSHGHGDQELYDKAEKVLTLMNRTVAKFQKAQAGLTNGDVHVRVATGIGRTHELHLTRPDIVAEEVKWVFDGFFER